MPPPQTETTEQDFGAGELRIFLEVILPASVPAMAAGLRLGFGRALIGTVVGEFNAGLGFRIAVTGTEMRVGDMFVSVVMVMIIGVSVLQLMRWLENRIQSWRP